MRFSQFTHNPLRGVIPAHHDLLLGQTDGEAKQLDRSGRACGDE